MIGGNNGYGVLYKMKVLLFVATVFLMAGCQKQVAQKEVPDVSKLSKLDRISLSDLEGNPINLKDYKGKRVFLNLWATWCKPCIAEMPDISKANDILSGEEYVFLAASDESMKKIKDFVKKYDFTFQFVKMNNSIYDLDITALPSTLIIDAKGELIFEEVGARDWDSETELDRLRKF